MPDVAISQYQFPISEPYVSGHILTETEANVLNWHRIDLIRKIALKWVNSMERTAPDGVLTLDQMDLLAEKIRQLDETYVLAPKPPPRDSSYQRELQLVAHGRVRKDGPLPQAEYQARMAAEMAKPEVRQRARQLLIHNLRVTKIGDYL